MDLLRGVGGLVSPNPTSLPRLPLWAAPNGWDYWGRPWVYLDVPSGHSEVGVRSTLSPPSTWVTVAVLVDCPHKPQFLPDMVIVQSASVVAGRATRQARPLTQKGEISENMSLETAAKRLLPRGYGDHCSIAILEQLKAWEAFQMLNIGRRENPTMPKGDVTPAGCPRAKLHGETPETLSGRPTMTARAAETTCKSQASSTQTTPADKKLKQRPVIDLSRMGEEELKGISSKGSSQPPRTSTPVERAPPQVTESEPMDVDTQGEPSTSQGSGASAAVHPKEKGASALRAQTQLTGPRKHADQKAKQRATDQQGIRAMVTNVLERQGVEQEDWEQSQGTNYRVEPLRPPTWVIRPPPGQHLAMLEGILVDKWPAEPDITPEELLRRLTAVARGTSQACSYRGQELYFRTIQVAKETIKNYEEEQGLQYGENAVHLHRDLVGLIIATFAHHQSELRTVRESRQTAWDREVDAKVHRRVAEKREAQLKCNLERSRGEVLEVQETARKHERDYHETLVLLRRAEAANPATAKAEAQVHIQSLETQLNDATQQLNQLRAERAPNAADGQMAVQQWETKEQLEALRAENVAAHKALAEMTADHDSTRKACVQLRMDTLTEKAKQDAASNALEVRCLQAEAEVVELKEKISTLERRGGYHVSPTTTSATLGSYSQPAFGRKGSGLVAQVSPQPGRGMSGLSMPQAPMPPPLGRGLMAHLARARIGSLNSTLTSSPGTGSGLSALVPG